MTEWQPIETAPPCAEDANIMAFDGVRVGEVRAWRVSYDWDEDSHGPTNEKYEWWWANDSCDCCYFAPQSPLTHWMPLPAPPA